MSLVVTLEGTNKHIWSTRLVLSHTLTPLLRPTVYADCRYPLADHVEENAAISKECIDMTRDVLRANHGEVAAMIIEPIQGEGGDCHGTPEYFRALRQLALDENVIFIVDEVQAGFVASGHTWAHESWDLEVPPDMMSFGKKTQICGYYYTEELQMSLPYRIFNTWMGDPAKLLQLQAVIDVVDRDNLRQRARDTGDAILAGLLDIESRFSDLAMNARGQGTLCAIDFADTVSRDMVVSRLRDSGVLVGGCGDRTLRLRPPLTLTQHHANIFLETLERVIETLR